MGIGYSSMMLVGCHFNDLPEEIRELDDIHQFIDDNGLARASEWYDAGTDGMLLGIEVDSTVEYAGLDAFREEVEAAFKVARELLKVEPKLIATQDIW